jgi:hypothetical protein
MEEREKGVLIERKRERKEKRRLHVSRAISQIKMSGNLRGLYD